MHDVRFQISIRCVKSGDSDVPRIFEEIRQAREKLQDMFHTNHEGITESDLFSWRFVAYMRTTPWWRLFFSREYAWYAAGFTVDAVEIVAALERDFLEARTGGCYIHVNFRRS